jgi:hypothetical protein
LIDFFMPLSQGVPQGLHMPRSYPDYFWDFSRDEAMIGIIPGDILRTKPFPWHIHPILYVLVSSLPERNMAIMITFVACFLRESNAVF